MSIYIVTTIMHVYLQLVIYTSVLLFSICNTNMTFPPEDVVQKADRDKGSQ